MLAEQCLANGNCQGIVHWVKQTDWYVERQCTGTANLAEKKPWMNELINLQKIVDLLALEQYDDELLRTFGSLCGGLMAFEDTYIEVTPPTEELSIGETVTLTPTIHCSNGTCTGALVWSSKDPTIATVDELGKVTAKGKGATTVFVQSSDLPEIGGSATITVQSERVYAFTSGEVNGTGEGCNQWNCCETQTYNYLVQPTSQAVVQLLPSGQLSMQATVVNEEMYFFMVTNPGEDCGGSALIQSSLVNSLTATGLPDTPVPVTGVKMSGGYGFSVGLVGPIGTATITDSTVIIDVSHTELWGPGGCMAGTFSGQLVFTRVPGR